MKQNNIKELRHKKVLSQEDMAEALHLSQNAYSLIETGKTRLVDVERILIIAEKLSVRPVELGLFDELLSSSDYSTKTTVQDNRNTEKVIETLKEELVIKNTQIKQAIIQNSELLKLLNLKK